MYLELRVCFGQKQELAFSDSFASCICNLQVSHIFKPGGLAISGGSIEDKEREARNPPPVHHCDVTSRDLVPCQRRVHMSTGPRNNL